MISPEEAKRRGLIEHLSKPQSDYVFGAMSVYGASGHTGERLKISALLNERLGLSNYTKELVSLTFNFLIFPPEDKGVKREERKYHKRSEKKFFMDIKIADYEGFCKADEREALAILAQETLRGAAKFLSKEKHFDHQRFLRDLEDLFRREGIL